MDKTGLLRRVTQRASLVLLALIVSACAMTPAEPPPPPPVVVPLEPKADPAPPPPTPQVEPAPVAEKPPPPEPPAAGEPITQHVAIVLSSSLPAYVDVAARLVEYLENYDVYDMTDRSRSPQQAFSAIADSPAEFVVAIGLYAANVAKSFADVPVVFSQVFNVQEHGLIADDFKGVAILPPMSLQIEAWTRLDPEIRNIGAIVGEGHEDLIAEAELAMQERGIRFHYAVARSDRETIYHFNRLIRDIDGFLLFPDNRILSRTALVEILGDAARHHVQVAVFNDSLLEHGATFSSNAVDSDIAARIVDSLRDFRDGKPADAPAVAPLSEIRIQTNPEMARKFGLNIDSLNISEAVADAAE